MQTASAVLTGQPLPLARISRERFERMVEAAIWGPQDSVELLDGMVVTMSPQGHLHAYVVRRLTTLLSKLVADGAEVGVQLPFVAGDFQLPEPDLVISPGRQARGRHPDRALLIVEVADTSLDTDRTTKARIYAAAGVPEYWVVDVNREWIEVLTEPLDDHYGTARVARRGDRIELVALPGASVAVEDVFGE